MKKSLTLLVLFLILLSGCRKPKEGFYKMSFVSGTTGVEKIIDCIIFKEGGTRYLKGVDKQFNGVMNFSGNKFSVTIEFLDIVMGPNNVSTYELVGTSKRKKLTGSYTFTSTGQTGFGTINDTGTFTITRE
jgi:hypothetical protein